MAVLYVAVIAVLILEVGHLAATTWHEARARKRKRVNPG